MNHRTPYSPDAHAAELGIRIIDAQPPAGTLALWDEQTRTILTTPGLLHRQRRCVLAHELAHATQGDTALHLNELCAPPAPGITVAPHHICHYTAPGYTPILNQHRKDTTTNDTPPF